MPDTSGKGTQQQWRGDPHEVGGGRDDHERRRPCALLGRRERAKTLFKRSSNRSSPNTDPGMKLNSASEDERYDYSNVRDANRHSPGRCPNLKKLPHRGINLELEAKATRTGVNRGPGGPSANSKRSGYTSGKEKTCSFSGGGIGKTLRSGHGQEVVAHAPIKGIILR